MKLRLHHVPAARSFRVLWMLSEMGMECDIIPYSIRDGSLRAQEYMALSPAGRVPALEIDGQSIFESGAIIQYLCDLPEGQKFGRAPGHPERARFLELIHFSETMATHIQNLNMQHIFLRDPSMASPVVIKLETKRLELTLWAMEHMVEGQEWLLPTGFSAADIMMGFNLWAAPYYVRLTDMPNLRGYLTRLTSRSAYQRARELDGKQVIYDRDFYEVPNG